MKSKHPEGNSNNRFKARGNLLTLKPTKVEMELYRTTSTSKMVFAYYDNFEKYANSLRFEMYGNIVRRDANLGILPSQNRKAKKRSGR